MIVVVDLTSTPEPSEAAREGAQVRWERAVVELLIARGGLVDVDPRYAVLMDRRLILLLAGAREIP